jgi:hypothetical protein
VSSQLPLTLLSRISESCLTSNVDRRLAAPLIPDAAKRLRSVPPAAYPVPIFERHLPVDASLLLGGRGGEAIAGEAGRAAVGTSATSPHAVPQPISAVTMMTSTLRRTKASALGAGRTLLSAPVASAPATDERVAVTIAEADTKDIPWGIPLTRSEAAAGSQMADVVCQKLPATTEVCFFLVVSFRSSLGRPFDPLLFS